MTEVSEAQSVQSDTVLLESNQSELVRAEGVETGEEQLEESGDIEDVGE